jgi:glyoxylase-like metal-dependent hydrolase (beta-lactamase superfamily II)
VTGGDAEAVRAEPVTTIHHINCGTLVVPSYPTVVCHCLLLQDGERLALVDTGIGLQDVRTPLERLGQPLIDMAGFRFNESDTAVRRIEALGLSPGDVRHVVLTHGDPDHAGGLADFPDAHVHVSEEEQAHVASGHWRYVPVQFAHGPNWKTYGRSSRSWFGLEARRVELGFASDVLLVPLFGHTLGHCGVAVQQGDRWLLHAGDAYYLRAEMTADDHPVSALAARRADDDAKRRASLGHLRRLVRDHGDEVDVIGYHDLTELPARYPLPG